MPATVRLNDIVDALEMQLDESSSFLDLDTGRVETVSHALLREAEAAESGNEAPDFPTWQKPEWEMAKRIVSTDRFQELPTNFEVHEWACTTTPPGPVGTGSGWPGPWSSTT